MSTLLLMSQVDGCEVGGMIFVRGLCIMRVTPGAYRLRYELPVARVGPYEKNAVEICDWSEHAKSYKHNVKRRTGGKKKVQMSLGTVDDNGL